MADIELVIKIPEEKYNMIKNKMYCGIYDAEVYKVIANGTLLPEGHGRLIDYSWVVDNVIKQLGIKDERYLLEAEKALMAIVKIAPTIIEADMAESENKE